MTFNESIIETFKTIHLNHKEPVSKSNSKKRNRHVKDIIKRRKTYKDANTIIITKSGVRKTYF